MFEVEIETDCPFCGAPITLLLDPSVPAQRYVEDCEVCCRPLEVAYQSDGDAITALDVTAVEQ